jgi:glycosyltransferase involved in cell wall biosynthesis
MEAMASGLPVVSSAISGIPELVESGRTGFLTPPRDAAALADALHRLSADAALRRRMGRAGREKVLREFNVDSSAEALATLFASHGSAGSRRDSRAAPDRSGSRPAPEAHTCSVC